MPPFELPDPIEALTRGVRASVGSAVLWWFRAAQGAGYFLLGRFLARGVESLQDLAGVLRLRFVTRDDDRVGLLVRLDADFPVPQRRPEHLHRPASASVR